MSFSPKIVLLCCALGGCLSPAPRLQPGIQASYSAVNPSRMLAVTPVFFPNPLGKRAVESAEVSSQKLEHVLEVLVLKSFQNQPGVNGVSFNTVRQGSASPEPAPVPLMAEIVLTAAKERGHTGPQSAQLNPACALTRDTLEFYTRCVAVRPDWLKALNNLSGRVMNADTALLVFVTQLEKIQRAEKPTNIAQLSVLVVDTNSGKLVWGRETELAQTGATGATYPLWKPLLADMLDEPFWDKFPGRRSSIPTPTGENPTPNAVPSPTTVPTPTPSAGASRQETP